MTDVNKCRHSFFICETDFQVDKNSHHSAMESERVIVMIVALFLLIIAIRKVQRFRFLALYFLRKRRHHEITIALLARKIRQQRRRRAAFARRRRAAWVYPRPQGWFEEMYENQVMSSLWKNDFRVSKDMFSSRQNYLCRNGPSNCDTHSKVSTAESTCVELSQSKSWMLHVKKNDKLSSKANKF